MWVGQPLVVFANNSHYWRPQKIRKQAKIINCAQTQNTTYEMRIFRHSGSPANVEIPTLIITLIENYSSHIIM
ncbi:hypothetical protein Y032_0028g1659 [Ancylostoma ceylanicum]|uniref:Uncharacterized protein n=1 Tax=Ancylostoma ceylanicum TaxID=53326 RepID=A0A016UT11_9BILA|nr:hypothetical protein Y032_0028g1659 [Ancylostoma ceylanicum]